MVKTGDVILVCKSDELEAELKADEAQLAGRRGRAADTPSPTSQPRTRAATEVVRQLRQAVATSRRTGSPS